MKKILCFVLSLVLLAGVFAISASAEKKSGQYVNGIWHYDEPVTVKVIVAYWAEYTDNAARKWMYAWAADKMNIVLDVVGAIPYSSLNEQTSLLFAGGELPDALLGFHNMNGTTAINYGDTTKQILPIDELITEEQMPNLYALMNELPIAKKINTPGGHFYTMPEIFEVPINYPTVAMTPVIYDKSLFQAAGYDAMPTDMDELLDALRAIKALDPNGFGEEFVVWGGSGDAPLLPFFRACGFYEWQDNLFSFTKADYLYGGEMVATGLVDNYYEYLKIANTLYEEGLIERDLYTLDSAQVNARAMEGKYGAFPSFALNNNVVQDWSKWYYAPVITSSLDETPHVSCYTTAGSSALMTICSGASEEAIDALLRFADVHYDMQFKYTTIRGPQPGEDLYGIIDEPVWEWRENDNGILVPYQLALYTEDCQFKNWADLLTQVSTLTWSGSPVDRRAPSADWYIYDIDKEKERGAATFCAEYGPYAADFYGGGNFEGAELERYQDLRSSLTEYFKTETAKFITGVRELNDEEWEKWKNDLLELGYEEYFQMELDYYNEHYN